MDTQPVETATPVEQPVTDTPSQPVESESLADHAAQFDPKRMPVADEAGDTPESVQRARDEQGKFARERRHRSERNRASAEDVPRIRELTKKLSEEAAERQSLAEKYAALENEVKTLRTPKPLEAPKPFEDKKPEFTQFENAPDPLAAWTEAAAAHAAKQHAAETEKQRFEAEKAAREKAEYDGAWQRYHGRREAYAKTTPDFAEVVSKVTTRNTPLLETALLLDERGPEFVYTLAKRPDLLAEVLFLTDGRAVTEESVANLRRLLASRIQVATTGSTVSAAPAYVPPKPPNPVRTGPTRRGDDLPGDDASLAEHEKAFGRTKRRA